VSAIAAATGSTFAGRAYPIGVALMTAVVGFFFLKETHHVRIWDEITGAEPASQDQPVVVDVGNEVPTERSP
jgi:hypothetical protein